MSDKDYSVFFLFFFHDYKLLRNVSVSDALFQIFIDLFIFLKIFLAILKVQVRENDLSLFLSLELSCHKLPAENSWRHTYIYIYIRHFLLKKYDLFCL